MWGLELILAIATEPSTIAFGAWVCHVGVAGPSTWAGIFASSALCNIATRIRQSAWRYIINHSCAHDAAF